MNTKTTFANGILATVAIVSMSTSPVLAQPADDTRAFQPADNNSRRLERAAGDILAQPFRDAGLMGLGIPDPLVRATIDSYGLPDDMSCDQVGSEIEELSRFLGSDDIATADPGESRVGRLAEAGGRAAVNSLIPFRTFVREVTGAGPAQRRFQTAVNMGYARRGFLRAVYRLRNCASAGGAERLTLNVAPRPWP